MKFRSVSSPRKRVTKKFHGPSLTKQSFKNECDINQVLMRWKKTGVIEHLNRSSGDYSDFMHVEDYHASMNAILSAQEAFNDLPALVRKRFSNSPALFLDYVSDPSNMDELVKMGLATPRSVAKPNVSDDIDDSGKSPGLTD